MKVAKPSSAESWTNPFDSDDEGKDSKKYSSSRKTSSERALATLEVNTNPFDDDIDANKKSSSTSYAFQSANRNRYKNDFRDSGGLENQSVQELESYAVYKAEETTNSVNNCLKIAENIREEATQTLVTLHQQGEQITRSHHVAADIDHDLSRVSILLINTLFSVPIWVASSCCFTFVKILCCFKTSSFCHETLLNSNQYSALKLTKFDYCFFQGEKLLGSLGGLFSKTWKPKKTRAITGPVIVGG